MNHTPLTEAFLVCCFLWNSLRVVVSNHRFGGWHMTTREGDRCFHSWTDWENPSSRDLVLKPFSNLRCVRSSSAAAIIVKFDMSHTERLRWWTLGNLEAICSSVEFSSQCTSWWSINEDKQGILKWMTSEWGMSSKFVPLSFSSPTHQLFLILAWIAASLLEAQESVKRGILCSVMRSVWLCMCGGGLRFGVTICGIHSESFLWRPPPHLAGGSSFLRTTSMCLRQGHTLL